MNKGAAGLLEGLTQYVHKILSFRHLADDGIVPETEEFYLVLQYLRRYPAYVVRYRAHLV